MDLNISIHISFLRSICTQWFLHHLADQPSSKLDCHPWTLTRISWPQSITRNLDPPSLPHMSKAHRCPTTIHCLHYEAFLTSVVRVLLQPRALTSSAMIALVAESSLS